MKAQGAVLLALLAGAGWLQAQVTNVYQSGVGGYSNTVAAAISTQDLQDTSGNGNTETAADVFGDGELPVWRIDYEERTLIRFDHLDLPPGARVLSASLDLTFDNFESGLEIDGGYLAAAWDPTELGPTGLGWLFREAGVRWDVPGAGGLGTDLVAGKGFVLTGFSGTGIEVKTVPLDVAMVQGWNTDPPSNQGVILLNALSNKIARVYAPWHSTVSFHPRLTITYQPGVPPTVARAATASPNPVTGTTNALSVLGSDSGGESALVYSWSALSKPAGAPEPMFSPNGAHVASDSTATYVAAGDYVLQAIIRNPTGLTATSSVPVTVDAVITRIEVVPSGVDVLTNSALQFSATAIDQFGNPLASQPVFAWSVTGGGAVESNGRFTAGTAPGGPFSISAQSGSIHGTAQFHVKLPNKLPTVALVSPDAGNMFTLPTNVTLVANASDPDGSVTNVEFYDASLKLGQSPSAPFTLTWTNPLAGAHTLSAVAFDNDGGSVTSAPVAITILVAPHPRIWLAAAALARLESAAASNSAAWTTLKGQCDFYLGGTVEFPDGNAYPDGGSIGEGYQGDGYLHPLLNVALAYQTLKRAAPNAAILYAQKGVDILTKMSEPTNSVHGVNPLRDDGYGIRNYGVGMAVGYDWLYDAMTPEQRARVYASLDTWIQAYENGGFGRNHPQGNYFAGYYDTKALAALATDGDDPTAGQAWEDFLGRVHGQMVQPYYNTWLAGGGWPEGWEYGIVASLNMMFPALAAKSGKGLDLIRQPAAYNYPSDEGWAVMYLSWPSLITLDDRGTLHSGEDHNASRLDPSLLAVQPGLLALLEADAAPLFHRFARDARAAQAGLGIAANAWQDFLFWDETAREEDYKILPRSYLAPGLNLALARSSWETNAVWASFQAGPYVDNPDASEELFDEGSLAIVKGQTPFLVNPTGLLVNDPTRGNEFENLILDDDFNEQTTNGYRGLFNIFEVRKGPRLITQTISGAPSPTGVENPALARTRVTRYEDAGDFLALEGAHLEDVYSNDPDDSSKPVVLGWTRDVVYLRPRIFVAFDRTTIVDGQLQQFQTFHFGAEPKSAGSPGRFDMAQGGAFLGAATVLMPATRSVVVTNVFDSGTVYRLEVHAGDTNTSQRWLTVIDGSDSAGEVAGTVRYSAQDGNVLAGAVAGAMLADGESRSLILFNAEATDPLSSPTIRYTVPTNAILNVICGVPARVGFAITAAVTGVSHEILINAGSDFRSSAGGVLAFRVGTDGTISEGIRPRPAVLTLRPAGDSSRFSFYLSGTPAAPYVIETSKDLTAWSPSATNSLPDGVWYYQAGNSSVGGHQFYRARRQ